MLILKTRWWIIKALMHVYVRRAYFNTRFAKFCSNDSQRSGVEKNTHVEGMQM